MATTRPSPISASPALPCALPATRPAPTALSATEMGFLKSTAITWGHVWPTAPLVSTAISCRRARTVMTPAEHVMALKVPTAHPAQSGCLSMESVRRPVTQDQLQSSLLLQALVRAALPTASPVAMWQPVRLWSAISVSQAST